MMTRRQYRSILHILLLLLIITPIIIMIARCSARTTTSSSSFIIINNLLLQHNAVHTSFEQRVHRRRFAFEMSQSIQSQGGRRVGEIGEGVR